MSASVTGPSTADTPPGSGTDSPAPPSMTVPERSSRWLPRHGYSRRASPSRSCCRTGSRKLRTVTSRAPSLTSCTSCYSAPRQSIPPDHETRPEMDNRLGTSAERYRHTPVFMAGAANLDGGRRRDAADGSRRKTRRARPGRYRRRSTGPGRAGRRFLDYKIFDTELDPNGQGSFVLAPQDQSTTGQ